MLVDEEQEAFIFILAIEKKAKGKQGDAVLNTNNNCAGNCFLIGILNLKVCNFNNYSNHCKLV